MQLQHIIKPTSQYAFPMQSPTIPPSLSLPLGETQRLNKQTDKHPSLHDIFHKTHHPNPSMMLLIVLLLRLFAAASGFGSMGPIAAAFGEGSFFCAIDAGGQQAAVCWAKNATSSSASPGNFSAVPSVAALSGGEGFMCGLLSNTSQAFCWDSNGSGTNLVPSSFRAYSYSRIAAGKNHVCAVRGSYYTDSDLGSIDCWDVVERSKNQGLTSQQSSQYSDQNLAGLVFTDLVSGDGFSCGSEKDGGLFCWGPNSNNLGVSQASEKFSSLTSGSSSICGISHSSGEIKCYGDSNTYKDLPIGARFVSLTASDHHFCGIREETHAIECWGRFNSSAVPKISGFYAIASSDTVTCGIREDDLVLDCWFYNPSTVPLDYNPPLQLCSPGLCRIESCGESAFAFNASALNEAGLTSLCVRKGLTICSPCASNCSDGFFLSSPCTSSADRVCTPCSFCQNSSCWEACGLQAAENRTKRQHQMKRLVIILGPAIAGFLLIITGWCLFPYLFFFKSKHGPKKQFKSCIGIGKKDLEADPNADPSPQITVASCPGEAQIFRLSELKDATNGFKEFNELGRGSYGFVYKAVLTDGKQVAVKRANAATIIHTNIRDFEAELEILCKLRHPNIVNLLGYCTEMGERLLVYEYLPHGTLHDHLHGGLSPLNWTVRLKAASQAAKGLEYLHMEPVPPIIHRNVKTSNILLDSDWGARVSDFGCSNLNEKDPGEDMKADVHSFGIVLLEILSGRKAYDIDYTPADIVEWAVPLIKKGKAAATIDRYVALPRNVEPLLRLADVAEAAVREKSSERPSMAEVSILLEQIVREGLIL